MKRQRRQPAPAMVELLRVFEMRFVAALVDLAASKQLTERMPR